MEKGIYVKDIQVGQEYSGLFIASQANLSQTRANKQFWRLSLSDKTGSTEAKIWPPLSLEITNFPQSSIVKAKGKAEIFNNQTYLNVYTIDILDTDKQKEIDFSDFLPVSKYNTQEMFDKLKFLCKEEFTYGPWKKFIFSVLDDKNISEKLCFSPAAKGVHHAYIGGLLEHTLSVFTLCQKIADQYPNLDRQTLLAGALFHDIGKIEEMYINLTTEYTDIGKLLGHLFLGVTLLTPFLNKSGLEDDLKTHLKHLILSHHGLMEHGAVRPPQTAEALALHYADNLDAKMAQAKELFQNLNDNEFWTPYQKTLDRSLYKSPKSPDYQPKKSIKKLKKVEEECFSLLKE